MDEINESQVDDISLKTFFKRLAQAYGFALFAAAFLSWVGYVVGV